MPKKIQDCTKASLIDIALPVHGDSYTVISHESVMDMSATALANAGFSIADEEYRATADGNIAQAIYRLTYNNDPELSMMFAWTNSYNKQVRFKCGVGAFINKTGTVMVCGDMGNWSRKHTGTADEETLNTITDQIANAQMYYDQLVSDKEAMKQVPMTKRKQAQMLGILFAEYQILTTEQASIIRNQMHKPTHVFEESGSLWAFYNYVTLALQHSHPKTWMEDQRVLHYFISSIIGSQAPVVPTPVIVTEPEVFVDPNQTNLLDQIAEVEAEEVIDRNITIDEVMEQSMKDELIFGVSGVKITEDAIENISIDEVIHYTDFAEKEIEHCIDDIIMQYTDPAGNTFEAPVVPPCAGHDAEAVKDLEDEILSTEVENFFEEVNPDMSSIAMAPADFEMMEAIEESEGTPIEANLDKVPTDTDDFELNFSSDDDEDDDIAFEF
jgi:hypothetical protein